MKTKDEGHEVSGEQGSVRLKIQKTILVVFAERMLETILLCVLHVTDGFIKGAVSSQVD